jgi:spore maturation protein CgeB
MRIAYIGTRTGTSGHRKAALERLGNNVFHLDPGLYRPAGRPGIYWMKYGGSVGLTGQIRRMLERDLGERRFDVAWVDHGELISRDCVNMLKRVSKAVLCYNVDDPFGRRDVNLWHQYKRAVPEYDLLVVVRKPNVEEAYRAGAKQVKLVFRAADEIAHRRTVMQNLDNESRTSEVLFLGTAFPERGPFMLELMERGVPITIQGDRWNRLKEWPLLRGVWNGPGIYDDKQYAQSIVGAKVCLGLLSKGNRDLHTQRSMEIPSLGAVLCAERTEEHELLYSDRKEAIFWKDAEECANVCKELLNNEQLRRSIANAGHERFKKNNWTNMRVAQEILSSVGAN